MTDFDPSRTNPIYDELKDSWLLNRDFAEMHNHILREGRHLDEFGGASRESAAQYAWRKSVSFAMDHCADLINLRVDNILRSAPVRTFADSPHAEFIGRFLADVDGGGTTLDQFMRRALRMYYTNGADIVVDKLAPRRGERPRTLAQEQQLRLAPYLHLFGPLERLDWACDHAGRYLWARYDLGTTPPPDESASAGVGRRYLTITRHAWRLHTVGDGDAEGRTVGSVEGPTALRRCPIVRFYFKESTRPDYPAVPLSLLTRIAPVARYMLNLLSQAQVDILRNIGFMVATGVEAEQIPREIQAMSCWALPEGATLTDVAGSVEHIREKRRWIVMLMEAILRIGKLVGAIGEVKGRPGSALQVAVERTDLDNEMRMTAVQAEAAEREIVRLAAARHVGRPLRDEEVRYSVEYNKTFVLTPAIELVRQARQFARIGVGGQVPSILRLHLRKILDALSKPGDPDYEAALEEVRSATFGRNETDGSRPEENEQG